MTVRSVSVRVSRKMTRDYNSTEFSVELSADVDLGENPEGVVLTLREQAKDQVGAAFRSLQSGS